MATPRAATGSGLRRRRLRTSMTGRAASTARWSGGTAAVSCGRESLALRNTLASPSAMSRRRRPVILTARSACASEDRRLTPAARSRSRLAACQRTITPRRTRRQPDASAATHNRGARPPETRRTLWLGARQPDCRSSVTDASLKSWRSAVNDAIRSFDHVYGSCEDPPPSANTGVCSSSEPGSLTFGIETYDPAADVTRPPTLRDGRRQHRSALAGTAPREHAARSACAVP